MEQNMTGLIVVKTMQEIQLVIEIIIIIIICQLDNTLATQIIRLMDKETTS